MVQILSGISAAWRAMFPGIVGEVQDNSDELVENEVNQALAGERENICPAREDMTAFGWVTGDNNPIHSMVERAKKLGFKDTPVMGMHIAAYGEQFSHGVIQRMRRYWGGEVKVIGQSTTIKSPLYPRERTLWQVTEYKKRDTGIDLKILGTSGEQTIAEVTTKIGREYALMPQIAGPMYNRRFLLGEDHLESFYQAIGAKNDGTIPTMLPAAYVPATLLRLLEDRTGTIEGTIINMDFNSIRNAKLGRLQVDIFPTREPRELMKTDTLTKERVSAGFLYKFKAMVSQDTKPITYGEVTTVSPIKLDLAS